MATPFMNLTLPTPGPGGTAGPDYATALVAALEAIDAHDHSSGKGSRVTPSGLNINADLDFDSNDAYNLQALRLDNLSSLLTGASYLRSLQVVSGELHFRDHAGNDVQITSAGAINAASVGGIGGDYGTSSASATYSNTTKTFLWTQSSGVTAKMAMGDIELYENTSGANPITIKSPNSLAASYTLTLLTGLPASVTEILQVDTGGQITSSNTLGTIKTDQIDESTSGAGVTIDSALIKDGRAPFPSKHIQGMVPSNDDAADGDDINFTAGEARDSTGAYNIVASAEMTKQADATWASGDNAGGLASGISWSASTTYYWFLLGKSTDPGAYDYGIDTSQTALNLMADSAVQTAGFDIYRQVWSARSSGTPGWPGFTGTELAGGGLAVALLAGQTVRNGFNSNTSRNTVDSLAPPGVLAELLCQLDYTSADADAWVRDTSFTDVTPDGSSADMRAGTNTTLMFQNKFVRVDASMEIAHRQDNTGSDLSIHLLGWQDSRR